jgi:DMSO/TMAO reductase YedYZ molybdopterin-dependent catalytic subunit
MATRGFFGRQRDPSLENRVPPGQALTTDFPVLSIKPTPVVDLAAWKFMLRHRAKPLKTWNWDEFNALPKTKMTRDIHCVTTWSKLDTVWEGVSFDDILAEAGLAEPPTPYILAYSAEGYTTNVPVKDLVDGKAMIATHYDGKPLEAEHGGPARLLVPHLYFWKSAKWVTGLKFTEEDTLGFWELRGYHAYGDPWREQRYTGDP